MLPAKFSLAEVLRLWTVIFSICSIAGATATLKPLQLEEPIADVAYDPYSGQLYVATAPSNGVSRIALLNQETISLGPALVQGQGAATIEPDGIGGLYVGFQDSRTIVRHDLSAGTNSVPFSFGAGLTLEGIKVVSAEEGLLAISRRHANPGFFDTTIFRDGVALPDDELFQFVRAVEPGGEHVYSTVAGFHKLRVTTNGLELASSITNGMPGFNPDISVRSNQVIFGTGLITDLDFLPHAIVPSSPQQATFAVPSLTFTDHRTNDLAFVWFQSAFGFYFVLYDPVARANKALVTLPLPIFPAEIFPWGASSYGVRWNESGEGRLAVIDLQEVPESDLSLTVTASSEAVTNQQPISYTITLRNNGPDAAANIAVGQELTFGQMLQSASSSGGAQPELWANTATWRVPALPVGESLTMTVNAIATGPMFAVSEANLFFPGTDPVPTNNAAIHTVSVNAEIVRNGLLVHLPAGEISARRETGDIYLSRTSMTEPFPYSVIRWNVETNTVKQVAAYPVPPGVITFSKDERYLFVNLPGLGEIEQIDLSGETDPIRFASEFQQYAGDIDALPGRPTSIVVGSGYGSRVFDNGISRPTVGQPGANAVLSDTRAIQFDGRMAKLRELLFTPEGIIATDFTNQPVQVFTDIYAASGQVFTQTGLVLDPANGAVLNTVETGVAPVWAFDEAADEFYILSHDHTKWTLKRFRLSTLTKLAEVPVPSPLESVHSLIKVSEGMFAYRTPSSVVVFVEPPLADADIAISSSITPSVSGSAAEPFLWNVTVTNRGPDIASNIVVIATLEGPALFWKPVDGKNPSYPTPFTRIVPTLEPGASHTLTLAITAGVGGHFSLTARAERFGPDSDFGNNSVVEEYSLAPAPGIIRRYRLPISDIDFDESAERLLMTTAAAAKGLENSLVALNLNNYFLTRLLSFSSAPGFIAAADGADAGFVNVENNTKTAPFEIEPRRLGEPFPIGSSISFELLARPGTTNVVAVSEWGGVSIYTNGVGALISTPGAIAFDREKPDDLFVYHDTGVLSRFKLGTPNVETSNRLTSGEIMPMVAVNGQVIFGDGQMADQETLQYTGRFPGVATNQSPGLIAVDEGGGRVYLYLHGRNSDEILIFDAESFSLLGSMVFEWTPKPVRFRAHNNRLALLDYAPNGFQYFQVHIFEIPPTNHVELGATGADLSALEGVATMLSVNARNESPWKATNAIVELQLPENFTVESVPGTNSYEILGNVIRYLLPEMVSGAPQSLQVVGRFAAVGTNVIRGRIRSGLSELNESNNDFEFRAAVVGMPTLRATNFTAVEGSSTQLRFSLSHAVPVPVRFTLTITNGSATPGQVFRPPFNTVLPLQFAPGFTNAGTQLMQTLQNNLVDGQRTLTLLLSNGTNVNFEATTLTLNYLDDEGIPILSPAVSTTQLTEAATNRTFEVMFTLNRPQMVQGQFQYRLISETAAEDLDYLGNSGTMVVPVGMRMTNIAVTVLADEIPEGPETLRLELSAPENVQFNPEMLRLTIREAATPVDQILGARLEGGRVNIRFMTAPQKTYRLVRSPDASSDEWWPVGDVTSHSTNVSELSDPEPATNRMMFYRVEKR